MSRLLATHCLSLIRLSAYLAFTFALIPVQALALWRGWSLAVRLPMAYHKCTCRILGFRHEIRGQISTDRPVLFVVNHASYIDIELLGAALPASFVAKSEVRKWPLFGLLARLQRTVFVDRRVRSSAQQRDNLTERLQQGGNLILFPEGTSGDGTRVLPFKSALFSAADIRIDGKPVTVQPVSISYIRLNGMPMGRDQRVNFAWYGDMALAGHLWTMIGQGLAEVAIQFHPAVTIDRFGSRKKLAEHCYRVISESVAAANAGRLPPVTADLVATAA